MKELFRMDAGDYNIYGKIVSRPSARGIIYDDGKMLLVYSRKYDYYKFPGGGIKCGEDPIAALIREVKEETGYQVLPESVQEYGSVLRRKKDDWDEKGIFEQENFYYICQIAGEWETQKLDDYEREEGFTPVWVEAMTASRHNRYESAYLGVEPDMLRRDARVMDMADLDCRRMERVQREEAFLGKLGDPEYEQMLHYVEQQLNTPEALDTESRGDIRYSRYEHTKRVLGYAKRLYDQAENQQQLDYEAIITATIFHDVGRAVSGQTGEPHAQAGIPITQKYLLQHGFDQERTDYICSLVGRHSDKYLMKEPEMDPNLLVLQEADLLDDSGALGIVMDCMITERRNPQAGFLDSLDHIRRYTERIQKFNPMRSAVGRKIWDEKTKLVEEFVSALSRDIEW